MKDIDQIKAEKKHFNKLAKKNLESIRETLLSQLEEVESAINGEISARYAADSLITDGRLARHAKQTLEYAVISEMLEGQLEEEEE